MTYRIRDIPALPILYLLHLIFTLSSLLVRLYEALSSHSPETSLVSPPRHVALVLARSRRKARDVREEGIEIRAMVESVRRVVHWAGNEGVNEISIWDREGTIQAYQDDIIDGFQPLPLSPPNSSPSTPTKKTSELPRALAPDTVISSQTITLYPTSKPLLLHLIPPSATHLVAELTRSYVERGIKPTQKILDTDIRASLGFERDPDLLIVHPISRLSFFKALLPRSPPELHGYPFWPLRITEIYQHPTPLPIPQPLRELFTILLDRAQVSSLPLIRKIARSIPARDPSIEPNVSGAVSRDEWEGAMRAWSQVEQRLGK